MPQQKSWLARTANAATAGIGNFAGGIVQAAGNGVAGAGKGAGASVTNTSRTWGDTVRNYGNYIKDVSGAQGSRAPTGQNPLGLSSTPTGAKASGVKKKIAPSTGGYKASSGTRGQSASNPLGL